MFVMWTRPVLSIGSHLSFARVKDVKPHDLLVLELGFCHVEIEAKPLMRLKVVVGVIAPHLHGRRTLDIRHPPTLGTTTRDHDRLRLI